MNNKAEVTFKLICDTTLGDAVCLVGNVEELGTWSANEAVALSSEKYSPECHLWQSHAVPLPLNTHIEYKFFIRNGAGKIEWEQLPDHSNRVLYFSHKQHAEVMSMFGSASRQISVCDNEYTREETKDEAVCMDQKFTLVRLL